MKFFKLAALQMMIASAQEIKPEEKIISRGGDIRLRFVLGQFLL